MQVQPNLGWHLALAFDINDKGQIVGVAFLKNGGNGFLLTPRETAVMPWVPPIWGPVAFVIWVGGQGILFPPGGGHPVPIGPDPWGPPTWTNLPAQEREVLVSLALANLASVMGTRTARLQIREAALAAASSALADLQLRDTGALVDPGGSLFDQPFRQRQLLGNWQSQ
jgi:hypothetical protein